MNFYGLKQNELEEWLKNHNFPLAHARTIFQLVYKEKINFIYSLNHSDALLTNLPTQLLKKLAVDFDFTLPKIKTAHQSQDQTIKLLIEFSDGKSVETVLIPFHHKHTICLSTQVGCAMNCSFCYTGTQGLTRNLAPHEIIGLYLVTYKYFEEVTGKKQVKPNIVYMGQGEPLHNFDNVKKATEIFLETYGIELGPRNITLSTAGYLPGLEKFTEFPRINIALSLHSAIDEKRNALIPLNQKYPLTTILTALSKLPRLKRQYIMCEYLLIKDFNDSFADAEVLIETIKDLPVIINLIPFNPFPGSVYQRPEKSRVDEFKSWLEVKKIPAMIRTTKGDEILAACGQLYVDELNKKAKKVPTQI